MPCHMGYWKSEFLLFKVLSKTQWMLKEKVHSKCTSALCKKKGDIIKNVVEKLFF